MRVSVALQNLTVAYSGLYNAPMIIRALAYYIPLSIVFVAIWRFLNKP